MSLNFWVNYLFLAWTFQKIKLISQRYFQLFFFLLGYSRKNPNRGGWGYNFLKTPHGIFRFVTLKILRNCVTPLGNSNVKNQDPWKFHMSFSWTSLEIHLFFNWPLEFPHTFSSVPLEILYPQPPLFGLFLE